VGRLVDSIIRCPLFDYQLGLTVCSDGVRTLTIQEFSWCVAEAGTP